MSAQLLPPGPLSHNGHISEREIGDIAAARAARALAFGPVTDHSGRLNEAVLDLQKICNDILIQAQSAFESWEMAQAASELALHDPTFQAGMEFLGLDGLRTIHQALSDSGLLRAYRLSDDPGRDRVTLCTISRALRKSDVDVASEAWVRGLGYPEPIVQKTVKQYGEIRDRFLTTVPAEWSKSAPFDSELSKLREQVRPLRDNYLAHNVPWDGAGAPTYVASGRLVELTLDLSTDMALLLKGTVRGGASFRGSVRERARSYWQETLEGPRAKLQAHMRRLADLESFS